MNTPAQLAVSLRTLLQGSLDYAGMFPPARLSLGDAWAKYLQAWDSPHRWLLRSFVCPVGQLDALAEQFGHSPAPLAHFSAIGTPPDGANPLEQFGDASLLTAFYRRMAAQAGPAIELSYEVRPPAEAVADGAAWQSYCTTLVAQLRTAGVPLSDVFLEVPVSLPWLASLALPSTSSPWGWGLKFRTGGLDAGAFPSVDALAAAVAAVTAPPGQAHPLKSGSTAMAGSNVMLSNAAARYKATAGLHHPLPRPVPELGCTMHGFINLFVASVLAPSGGKAPTNAIADVPPSEQNEAQRLSLIAAILQDCDPQSFDFNEQRLSWRDCEASVAAIASARRHGLVAFGSCSFDEPIEDLQALGWI